MAIHSSGQTVFSLAHVEGITLGAGEEVFCLSFHVFLCACPTVISSIFSKFSLSFPLSCVIRTSVLSFPWDLYLNIISLSSGRTKGKVLHSDARTMVFKVYSFLKELLLEEVFAKTVFLQTHGLTDKACGVSVRLV